MYTEETLNVEEEELKCGTKVFLNGDKEKAVTYGERKAETLG